MEENEIKEQLRQKIIEKTEGKLSEEQIDEIVSNIVSLELNSDVQVTSDPNYVARESTEVMKPNEESRVTPIYGDIKQGIDNKSADLYELPDFNLNDIQVVVNENNLGRIQTTIYIPDKEYEEKGYEAYIEQKQKEDFKQQVMSKTEGKLSEEQIDEIVSNINIKDINSDIQVTSDPNYVAKESTEVMNPNEESKVTVIYGDIEPGVDDKSEDIYGLPEFSMNDVQVVLNENDLGRIQTTIYIPDREYKELFYSNWQEEHAHDISELEEAIQDRLPEDYNEATGVIKKEAIEKGEQETSQETPDESSL